MNTLPARASAAVRIVVRALPCRALLLLARGPRRGVDACARLRPASRAPRRRAPRRVPVASNRPERRPEHAAPGTPCWVDVKPYPFGSFTSLAGIEEAGPVERRKPGTWLAEHPECLRGGVLNRAAAKTRPRRTRVLPHRDLDGVQVVEPGARRHLSLRGWRRDRSRKEPLSASGSTTAKSGFRTRRSRVARSAPGTRSCGRESSTTGSSAALRPAAPRMRTGPAYAAMTASNTNGSHSRSRRPRSSASPSRRSRGSRAPPASLANAAKVVNAQPRPGGITSGTCLAWNDCWFFGTYGVAVHWNGQVLTDATPAASERWLSGEYLDAATSEDPLGIPFAMAVSSTAETVSAEHERELVPAQRGPSPPELFRSVGGDPGAGLGAEFALGAIGLSSALPFKPRDAWANERPRERVERPLPHGSRCGGPRRGRAGLGGGQSRGAALHGRRRSVVRAHVRER